MRKFIRANEPPICATYSSKWNDQWVNLRAQTPNAAFAWYKVEGKTARDHLLPHLHTQTHGHCSFCDAFPVDGVSNETIEHFRPKSRFPQFAYTWTNLYYCCDACQSSKKEQWDDQLLHPDAHDYKFSRFFEFDFTTGQIRPNPCSNKTDQDRAAATIKLYGLDSPSRRRNRLDHARHYDRCQPNERSNVLWAYRDFLGIEVG